MSELTYILGAGASFQSIPIVKAFSNRFKAFLDWIDKDIINDQGFSPEERQKFGILHELGKELHESFESHQSFDTYFKKLFHIGQNRKISEGKKILNQYFIWEHLSKPVAKPDKHNEFIFWKQSIIDKRYDALVAGLLKPLANTKEPYCKINFITWNYDLNLLMSLKNYFLPDSKVGDFYEQFDKKNGIWEIKDKITVINMNGFFYSSHFTDFVDLKKDTIYDIIYNNIKIENYFKPTQQTDKLLEYYKGDSDAELIKFAWETDNFSVAAAKDKISFSDNIVVIGYTFPLYNRLIDLSYLEQKYIGKNRMVIQDPNAEIIRQSLLDYYQLSDNDALRKNVRAIKDCDSFYIPSNIFGISEYKRGFTAATY